MDKLAQQKLNEIKDQPNLFNAVIEEMLVSATANFEKIADRKGRNPGALSRRIIECIPQLPMYDNIRFALAFAADFVCKNDGKATLGDYWQQTGDFLPSALHPMDADWKKEIYLIFMNMKK